MAEQQATSRAMDHDAEPRATEPSDLPDIDSLTPTQELVVEVLAARYRLGENVWTLTSRLRPTLETLSKMGYIGYKSGIVQGTHLAWLTPEGRAEALDDTYVPPILRSFQEAGEDRG